MKAYVRLLLVGQAAAHKVHHHRHYQQQVKQHPHHHQQQQVYQHHHHHHQQQGHQYQYQQAEQKAVPVPGLSDQQEHQVVQGVQNLKEHDQVGLLPLIYGDADETMMEVAEGVLEPNVGGLGDIGDVMKVEGMSPLLKESQKAHHHDYHSKLIEEQEQEDKGYAVEPQEHDDNQMNKVAFVQGQVRTRRRIEPTTFVQGQVRTRRRIEPTMSGDPVAQYSQADPQGHHPSKRRRISPQQHHARLRH